MAQTNNISDDNDDKKLDLDLEAQIGLILKRVEITENQYMKLQKETDSDVDLNKLKWYIQHRWPENKYLIPDSLKQYRAIMNEISNYSNLIFKGDQIVIPKTMRKEMLNRLHLSIRETGDLRSSIKEDTCEQLIQTRPAQSRIKACYSIAKYLD
ncbi:hypothetical protein CBL_12115 [Carabus blaptoides fortunei]